MERVWWHAVWNVWLNESAGSPNNLKKNAWTAQLICSLYKREWISDRIPGPFAALAGLVLQGASKKERDGHAHKHSHTHTLTSRSSLVNTATWLRSEDTDLEQWYWYKKEEGFLFSKAFRSVLGLASLLFRGNRGCSGGGGQKFRGKEVNPTSM